MPSHLQRPEVQWRKAELFDHCAEMALGASVEEDPCGQPVTGSSTILMPYMLSKALMTWASGTSEATGSLPPSTDESTVLDGAGR
jgi:hypothetical protein